MKRIACFSAFLLAALWPQVFPASAQPAQDDRAAELVAALAAAFRAMPAYEVAYEVVMGEQRVAGSYSVEGERYCLTLGDAEVFADAETRYEVDHRHREITVSGVDASDRSLLSDPVHAFDFINSGYRPSLLWERGGEAAVALTPAAASGALAGRITLFIDTRAMRPRSVVYDFDGEAIEVSVSHVGPLSRPFRFFSADRFAGFEWIDFR